ncbi:MAG TPA: hypothetical protein VIJ94_20450 [Caulobacteraceae bacterium]
MDDAYYEELCRLERLLGRQESLSDLMDRLQRRCEQIRALAHQDLTRADAQLIVLNELIDWVEAATDELMVDIKLSRSGRLKP